MAKPASDTKAALSRCILFKTLAPATLAELAEHARTSNVRRGAQVYAMGERCPGVYILINGRVMLTVGEQPDASKVVDLVGAGGHFGLAAAILDGPQTLAADALMDSALVMVPRAVLLDCAHAHPELAMNIASALSRGIVSLTADIESYSLHSGRQRVANYLLHIAAA